MTTKPKVTMKRAIELQCHECVGYYEDGKIDCENVRCTLYSWMPYRKKKPDLDKFLYSPRSVGKVLLAEKSKSRKPMTEAQKQVARERMIKMRKEGKI